MRSLDPWAELRQDLERRWELLSEAMVRCGVGLALSSQTSGWTEYVSGLARLQGRRSELAEENENLCALGAGTAPRLRLVHSNWKLEIEEAARERGYAVVEEPGNAEAAVRSLADGDQAAIWVDHDLPFHAVQLVRRAFPRAELIPFPPQAWRVRQRKSELEIERLRRAAELTEHVWRDVARALPGRFTRWDLLEECRHQFASVGSPVPAVQPNAYVLLREGYYEWGRPLALAPTDVIEAPAVITVDGGVRVDGYCADLGRTLVLGEQPSGWSRSYEIALAAQEAAIAAIGPGAPASAVDAAAREVVEQAGLGPAFWIPTGHGLGLDVHEPPRLDDAEDAPLEEGLVLAVEIGLWRRGAVETPGDVGAFVEDPVLVAASGGEPLTRSPLEPIRIAA